MKFNVFNIIWYLLHTENWRVHSQMLQRYQRKETKELQHRIFTLCDKYSEEEITVNTEEMRQYLQRPVMIWHKEDLTIHWLCICCVILST